MPEDPKRDTRGPHPSQDPAHLSERTAARPVDGNVSVHSEDTRAHRDPVGQETERREAREELHGAGAGSWRIPALVGILIVVAIGVVVWLAT